ncbi:carbohydrate sulfotransferase 11-like [Glandiceps talaboti]
MSESTSTLRLSRVRRILVFFILLTFTLCMAVTYLQVTDNLTNTKPGFLRHYIKYPEISKAADVMTLSTDRGKLYSSTIGDIERDLYKYNPDEVNRERLNISKTVCAQESLTSGRVNYYQKTYHLLQWKNYHFLMGLTPKVGTTMWKAIFRNSKEPSLRQYSRLVKLKEKVGNEKLRTDTKIVFYREPLERLVSCYYNKFYKESGVAKKYERSYRSFLLKYRPGVSVNDLQNGRRLNLTFAEFAEFVVEYGVSRQIDGFNHHWYPQYMVTNICLIDYDFIGHYETLATDGPYVLKLLGIEDVVKFPPIHNSTGRNRFIEEFKTLSPELVKNLTLYYQLDYKILGYEVPEELKMMVATLS